MQETLRTKASTALVVSKTSVSISPVSRRNMSSRLENFRETKTNKATS
jgi:hypothetical protein